MWTPFKWSNSVLSNKKYFQYEERKEEAQEEIYNYEKINKPCKISK